MNKTARSVSTSSIHAPPLHPGPGADPAQARGPASPAGLYDPRFEHDACGVGFVARLAGPPSHEIVHLALTALAHLSHRGAVDADGRTGDGAGLLTQLPRRLLAREVRRLGLGDPDPSDLAVGMLFLPRDPARRERGRRIVERAVDNLGIGRIGWRPVPVDLAALGEKAARTRPEIEQILLTRPSGASDREFERRLYRARKEIERRAAECGLDDLYVPSLSHRTVVYKGLFVAPQLPAFYADLRDPDFEASLAVFHQRYSTNTFPNWFLAQPFRLLAHNGEINTLQGNRNWLRAREPDLRSPVWGESIAALKPVVWEAGSDSASLDNVLDLLELSGRPIVHSLMMLVPEAWENVADLDPELRAFYHYHAGLMEPWDGPAALAFTDGTVVGVALDRNGLRPLRYKVTADGLVVAASEVGAVEIDEAGVVEKGRLGPGQLLVVDTARGRLLKNGEAKREIVAGRPYAEWLRRQAIHLPLAEPGRSPNGQSNGHSAAAGPSAGEVESADDLPRRQMVFGFNAEELKFVVEPMATEGKEPTWSMGDDAPLAVFSRQPRPLSAYFRQRFAQVTNPPIDPLRETSVMSLQTYLGPRGSLLVETEAQARLVNLPSPILGVADLAALLSLADRGFAATTLPATFPVAEGAAGLERSLARLTAAAEAAVDAGQAFLVLSDRGVDAEHAPIPMLLAVGAVHHHLIRAGKRLRADLLVETGELWEVHQLALLLGYGAGAVCPRLAWQSVAALASSAGFAPAVAAANFRKSLEAGLLKIMSKMGISTLSSYRGAQVFEALGLRQDLVDLAFAGTPSRIGGLGLAEIAREALRRHEAAYGTVGQVKLRDYGHYRFRREGEYHSYNPFVVRKLQAAARSGRYEDYQEYARLVNGRAPTHLRDLLELRPADPAPLPIEEVEPIEAIRARFTAQAMSLGALSPEAHQAISIAMNRIDGRSNTGEGGEDPESYRPRADGDSANNRIKQVASARFGVTAEYLAHATELEIKMAQGSKPGEGGQLPAHKVSQLIARFRRTIPGIPLISPPPHHDIYSIEDLAQLIYDLKQVNPRARVGVKLVSEAGVGTVAAGVAKAGADYVLISGQDGGTGASPLSSIKQAGCPWELGLAETQQVLTLNGLRDRVIVRVDGGLKTGRDVVVAAMLGAEEFGFATGVVVALGCDMARQCHLNTCPTGIATQREDLRKRFAGKPEMVINYLSLIAQEVRELLASLGVRRLDELVGRTDLLHQVLPPAEGAGEGGTLGWASVDLGLLLAGPSSDRPRRFVAPQPRPAGDLNDRLLRDAEPALAGRGPVRLSYEIRNRDRTVGARLGGEIGRRFGGEGLPDGTIDARFEGSAGQSFGAFASRGMRLVLTGEANDYVGKGLSGGEIVVRPPVRATYAWHSQVIAGNTVLYGATGGALFLAGRAGERFAVRNSGALGVVEGVGDHACEYMTSGLVVVLGETGRNFAAGMSAGVAYVLDEDGAFPGRHNPEMVSLERVASAEDEAELLDAIRRHLEATDSPRAAAIVADWEAYRPRFWKVVPHPPVTTAESATVLAAHKARPGQP